MKQKFRLWTKKEFGGAGKLDKKIEIERLKRDLKSSKQQIKKIKDNILDLKKKIVEIKERKVISERMTYEEYINKETILREQEGYEVIKD